MHIDKPCPDGSAIRATDGSLYCSLCDSHVIDLREVTERRAHALVSAARRESDRVCVRMFRDASGNPSFLLEPVRPRKRLPIAEVALVATLAAGCGATGSGAQETETTTQPVEGGDSCRVDQQNGTTTPTSGSETPPTVTEPATTHQRPLTNEPRTAPPDEMVDGGLG